MPSPHASLRDLYAAADNLKPIINECQDEENCQSLQPFQTKLNSVLSSWLENVRTGVDNVACNAISFDDFDESVRPFLESLWMSVAKLATKHTPHIENENGEMVPADICVPSKDEEKGI
jgi:hypothetical protein